MQSSQFPQEFEEFMQDWSDNDQDNKRAMQELADFLQGKPDIAFNFVSRPGISYSLRAKHTRQTGRQLFAMLDIIDDDPEARWLSICFYSEMIEDPEEKGDIIPGGLLGEDGYCFDLDEYQDTEVKYLQARLHEAYQSAAGNA